MFMSQELKENTCKLNTHRTTEIILSLRRFLRTPDHRRETSLKGRMEQHQNEVDSQTSKIKYCNCKKLSQRRNCILVIKVLHPKAFLSFILSNRYLIGFKDPVR